MLQDSHRLFLGSVASLYIFDQFEIINYVNANGNKFWYSSSDENHYDYDGSEGNDNDYDDLEDTGGDISEILGINI